MAYTRCVRLSSIHVAHFNTAFLLGQNAIDPKHVHIIQAVDNEWKPFLNMCSRVLFTLRIHNAYVCDSSIESFSDSHALTTTLFLPLLCTASKTSFKVVAFFFNTFLSHLWLWRECEKNDYPKKNSIFSQFSNLLFYHCFWNRK